MDWIASQMKSKIKVKVNNPAQPKEGRLNGAPSWFFTPRLFIQISESSEMAPHRARGTDLLRQS